MQRMGEITFIRTDDLHPFEQNPFHITDDSEMELLRSSIQMLGIITPLIVRPLAEGYEIISGHRRCAACKALGIEKVPAYVKNMSRDEAVITMVDCNLFREHLLPSEKAFAYRMKLDALKKQGFRTDLTSDQPGQKFSSIDRLAERSADSRTQIQRYIRLTRLIRPLLCLVDEGKIALTSGVELSYLSEEEQLNLADRILIEDCTPSRSQAVCMRKMSVQGSLPPDIIAKIMKQAKSNQKEVLRISAERIRKYFRPAVSRQQMEDVIIRALDFYTKYLAKHRNRDDR